MCKAAVPQPSPTNEVAEQIKNTTSVDNSWSFINLHLPSTITTAVIIFIIIISAWILLRLYNRFNKPRPRTPSGTTSTSLPMLASTPWPSAPPTPWTSTTSVPAPTSTSVTLDMDTLMKAVSLRPDHTLPTPVQATGPPAKAHFS